MIHLLSLFLFFSLQTRLSYMVFIPTISPHHSSLISGTARSPYISQFSRQTLPLDGSDFQSLIFSCSPHASSFLFCPPTHDCPLPCLHDNASVTSVYLVSELPSLFCSRSECVPLLLVNTACASLCPPSVFVYCSMFCLYHAKCTLYRCSIRARGCNLEGSWIWLLSEHKQTNFV